MKKAQNAPNKNTEKSSNNALGTIIGVSIVVLAVVIVFCVGIAPSVTARKKLDTRIELLDGKTLEHITVYDPDAKEDMLSLGGGVERVISDDRADTAKELILFALSASTYYETASDSDFDDYDYRFRFRIEGKKTADFYFKEGRIYIIEDAKRFYFVPSDSNAYNELIKLAKDAIETEKEQ